VFTRAQLRASGRSDRSIDTMIDSGAIEPLHPGLFVVRGAPLSYEARLWAAVLVTGGILGFATAAHMWGITDDIPDQVHVIIPRGLHLQRRLDIRTHRHLPQPVTRDRRHGLPVTSRTATLLDYVGRLSPGEATRVADRAAQRGWLRAADVDRRLRQQSGRTGNTRLRQVADAMGDGAAAHSERVLHRLLRQAGLPGWVANHDVWCGGDLVCVVDVAFPELRIAIEVDGWAFHHQPDRFQRDRVRQNQLVMLGWTILRFTWADLVERPGYVVATIRAQVAAA
jgi:very-short-patch-repair endonuclease